MPQIFVLVVAVVGIGAFWSIVVVVIRVVVVIGRRHRALFKWEFVFDGATCRRRMRVEEPARVVVLVVLLRRH